MLEITRINIRKKTLLGLKIRHFIILCFCGILILALGWNTLLKDYQKQRVISFLFPQSEPLGAGWSQSQAKIAIGSGGLFGKGLVAGTQSQLHFLRIQHTDYIFSVLGEEIGFVGALAFFVLLVIVLFRAVSIASECPDVFGQLIACGVTIMLFSQSFINVGMNIGLLPVTGIPLPFISSGGSSLLTILLAEGLLQSIAMHVRRPGF